MQPKADLFSHHRQAVFLHYLANMTNTEIVYFHLNAVS